MKEASLIHVRLDPAESIQSKKEILSTEANLIKILQIMKRYNSLRNQEMALKNKLLKKLKETKASINKLGLTLPKMPVAKTPKEKAHKVAQVKTKDTLDLQLEEIQKKLKQLGA